MARAKVRAMSVSGNFFEGNLVNEEELRNIIVRTNYDDATFYIVGEKSVNLAKSMGIVSDEGVMNVDGVSFALVLL